MLRRLYCAAACCSARGNLEDHILGCRPHNLDRHVVARLELLDDLLHENFGGGGAGGQSQCLDVQEVIPWNFRSLLHKHGFRTTGPESDFHEPLGVGAVGSADDENGVTFISDRFHGALPVRRRVTDVVLVRTLDEREARLQGLDHLDGVVDRQRRLRYIGKSGGIARREGFDILYFFNERHRAFGELTQGADDLGMAGVADQDDIEPGFEMTLGLDVNLRHERTGRVEIKEFPLRRFRRDRFRNAMSREYHGRIGIWDLAQLLDENRSFCFQAFDNGAVMYDFVPDVDRSPKLLDSHFHDLYRSVHTRAKPPWRGEQHIEVWFCRHRGHLRDLAIAKGVRNSAKRSNLAGKGGVQACGSFCGSLGSPSAFNPVPPCSNNERVKP